MATSQMQEVARRGERIYQEKLRELLEAESLHRFVAIEPESEDYFLGDTLSEAIQAARRAHPERLCYATRLGHSATLHLARMPASTTF